MRGVIPLTGAGVAQDAGHGACHVPLGVVTVLEKSGELESAVHGRSAMACCRRVGSPSVKTDSFQGARYASINRSSVGSAVSMRLTPGEPLSFKGCSISRKVAIEKKGWLMELPTSR